MQAQTSSGAFGIITVNEHPLELLVSHLRIDQERVQFTLGESCTDGSEYVFQRAR